MRDPTSTNKKTELTRQASK
uniref:Uncharacterized protein n=1 Tax=Arundo donax TaxID=35708 RepID=A0A0A9H883_ARUDO